MRSKGVSRATESLVLVAGNPTFQGAAFRLRSIVEESTAEGGNGSESV